MSEKKKQVEKKNSAVDEGHGIELITEPVTTQAKVNASGTELFSGNELSYNFTVVVNFSNHHNVKQIRRYSKVSLMRQLRARH